MNLNAWFGPLGAPQFFSHYWRQRMLTRMLGAEEFSSLLKTVGPLDPIALAPHARGGVEGWVANAHMAHSVLPLDANSVTKALGIDATVYFIDVPMPDLANAVATFIGADAEQITTSLFLTPKGGGASWHFDANENFTVQLTGEKRWAVAPTPCVPDADAGHVVGLHVPAALEGRLGSLAEEPAEHVTLTPGALLYVPRGTLHRTGADVESWSLNVAYRPGRPQ